MISTSTGLPTAITKNSSDARFRLGELYETWDATYGERIWRYILNKTGADLTIGLGVMQEDGTDRHEVALSGVATATVRMEGVAQHTITSLYYGFVLADGDGVAVSNGTTTANTAQKAVASGQFADGTIGTDELPVWALETESPAGAGGFFACRVRCL
jgi:hypothetical protein